MSSSQHTSSLEPIAPNVWVVEGDNPRLLGGRDQNGKIVFPIPDSDAGKAMEVTKLSSSGTLWSFTIPEPPTASLLLLPLALNIGAVLRRRSRVKRPRA